MAGNGENNEFIAEYLARLLINEVPFPGENSYKSVEDSKSSMTQILWVIHCRRYYIPPGYRQVYIANVKSENIAVLSAKCNKSPFGSYFLFLICYYTRCSVKYAREKF